PSAVQQGREIRLFSVGVAAEGGQRFCQQCRRQRAAPELGQKCLRQARKPIEHLLDGESNHQRLDRVCAQDQQGTLNTGDLVGAVVIGGIGGRHHATGQNRIARSEERRGGKGRRP